MRSQPIQAPAWLTARPIAHRGLHDPAARRPENTLAAFRAAIDHGYAIECDVQLAADGEAMVFHDPTLHRLTPTTGRVDALPAATLASLPVGGSDETIPRLIDLLDLAAPTATPLVVEIKGRFDGDLRLTHRVVALLKGRDQPVAVKSFDPRIVAALRMMLPDRPRGIVAMASYDYPDFAALPASERHAMANLLHYGATEPDFVSWRVGDLPAAAPFLARRGIGLPLMAWTVRTEAERARATEHADQMVFEGFLP